MDEIVSIDTSTQYAVDPLEIDKLKYTTIE